MTSSIGCSFSESNISSRSSKSNGSNNTSSRSSLNNSSSGGQGKTQVKTIVLGSELKPGNQSENNAQTHKWKGCENNVKKLWKFCENSVNTMWEFCEISVKILWKFCEKKQGAVSTINCQKQLENAVFSWRDLFTGFGPCPLSTFFTCISALQTIFPPSIPLSFPPPKYFFHQGFHQGFHTRVSAIVGGLKYLALPIWELVAYSTVGDLQA